MHWHLGSIIAVGGLAQGPLILPYFPKTQPDGSHSQADDPCSLLAQSFVMFIAH
jgi:hypothetical protein